jgi:uncharacterized protein
VRQLGDIEGARKLLENAARDGDVGAAWELGRMYADGDGVKQNAQRAFDYFGDIADSHADEPTGTVEARFVANAFVRLASYYLTGIPNSSIKPDAVRARDMFNYASRAAGSPRKVRMRSRFPATEMSAGCRPASAAESGVRLFNIGD